MGFKKFCEKTEKGIGYGLRAYGIVGTTLGTLGMLTGTILDKVLDKDIFNGDIEQTTGILLLTGVASYYIGRWATREDKPLVGSGGLEKTTEK